MTRAVILSYVERGWTAARSRALALPQEVSVIHIVKGRLDPSVRALVSSTHPAHLICAPRLMFWPVVWVSMAGGWMTGRLREVWVDNRKSQRRFASIEKLCGVTVRLVMDDATRSAV